MVVWTGSLNYKLLSTHLASPQLDVVCRGGGCGGAGASAIQVRVCTRAAGAAVWGYAGGAPELVVPDHSARIIVAIGACSGTVAVALLRGLQLGYPLHGCTHAGLKVNQLVAAQACGFQLQNNTTQTSQSDTKQQLA